MEALWEAGEHTGRRLSVSDQVAVVRELSSRGPEHLTPADVREVFKRLGLASPSASYDKAIASRVNRLVPRRGLCDVLVSYRQFALRELSGQFGGKTTGREEELSEQSPNLSSAARIHRSSQWEGQNRHCSAASAFTQNHRDQSLGKCPLV